jgi:NAD(P)-dependent dehydrogenase (short-subunit alcohol dehydrogenase family)
VTHVLVVGGTRGIGRAVVRRFAGEAVAVSVIGRREPEEVRLPNVRLWPVDLAETGMLEETVTAVVESGGPLTAVVFLQRFRGEGDAWEGELAVSLTATRVIIDAATTRFAEEGSAIVVVCSNASRLVADEQSAAYHAAKAALWQLVRYYAVALGPAGIRVNAVTPGTVVKEENRAGYAADELARAVEAATPLRRPGTSEDVAAAVAFLCGPDAAFVTGHDLVVDGGLSLLWQESLVRKLARDRETT